MAKRDYRHSDKYAVRIVVDEKTAKQEGVKKKKNSVTGKKSTKKIK
jgi:hypothetical protein